VIPNKQVDTTFVRSRIPLGIQKRIGQINWEVISSKLLPVACGLVLAGMLVAGLWPFHSPKNQVRWDAGGKGLHFGVHGTILSSGRFKVADVPAGAPCSLEIWFVPDFTAGEGVFFAFYAPGNPRQFSLRQSITDLLLASELREGRYRTLTTRLYIGDVFRRGKPLFVTVTSKGEQASIYIDGVLAAATPKFPLSSRDFDGELVVGTLPRVDDCWSGVLRGLAFFDRELSPPQVLHHFETWKEKGRPDVSENERAVALYLFDERSGRVIHNQVPSGLDLYIPDRYLVLDQVLLRPFWQEFRPTWSYWKDVLINIVGFVPFGFLFCAYFSLASRIKRPALVTILLGLTVSFIIEFLQSFLPTRDSGTTDLFTNTLGTCLGVWLYRLNFWRTLIARVYSSLKRVEAKV
jgi:VanZ family protein